MNPTPNGEWGVANSLEDAMEKIDQHISETEAEKWNQPKAEKASAFGTVRPIREGDL